MPQGRDNLTSYRGQTITYDEIGNPLSYYNGSAYTFTWENGRQLATAVKGGRTLSFEYNDEGIRTSKTVNGVEHIYYLNGSQIIAELWGNNMCIYLYDNDGSPIGMQYRTTSYAAGDFDTFWFTKNLQGDIVSVYNDNGTKLLTYHYDAWGNFTTQWHLYNGSDYYASYNPFKYRGYYHDSETGFYYLNSRYYDPATGRFLNADAQLNRGLLGNNMFAYCENNPVNHVDFNGYSYEDIKDRIKKFTDDYVDPAIEKVQSFLSGADATLSGGINISASAWIFSFNLMIMISCDTKGNVALQGSAGAGVTFNPSPLNWSASGFFGFSNAPSIDNLTGIAPVLGLSGEIPVYKAISILLGLDVALLFGDNNEIYVNPMIYVGYSPLPSIDFHGEASVTKTIFKINVFEGWDMVHEKISNW